MSVEDVRAKKKGKGLDTCYSATYMSQTRDQQRFTISEVAADWHEPMVPQHIMQRCQLGTMTIRKARPQKKGGNSGSKNRAK